MTAQVVSTVSYDRSGCVQYLLWPLKLCPLSPVTTRLCPLSPMTTHVVSIVFCDHSCCVHCVLWLFMLCSLSPSVVIEWHDETRNCWTLQWQTLHFELEVNIIIKYWANSLCWVGIGGRHGAILFVSRIGVPSYASWQLCPNLYTSLSLGRTVKHTW